MLEKKIFSLKEANPSSECSITFWKIILYFFFFGKFFFLKEYLDEDLTKRRKQSKQIKTFNFSEKVIFKLKICCLVDSFDAKLCKMLNKGFIVGKFLLKIVFCFLVAEKLFEKYSLTV